ncbi:discoidin domain-containing protein [Streptomyces sp. WAC 06738]|uniref:discoidin domain-containing protein n=1 Tax=Streptomyces sp. WAC 06738 TaxID=2203210 RepID=UPI001F0C5362|nr:discoidin domain-containing protein [Streptomyces sp. WAC 06738]
MARAERPRADSWLAVDLGAEQRVDRVLLGWEAAYGAEYRVQVSADGAAWRDVAAVPTAHRFTGNWVNVDDRAGFVVRGGSDPIRVTAGSVTLSAGPAAPLIAEGYPAQRAGRTRALAAAPAPTTDVPGVAAALADGHLAVFNLTNAAVRATVHVPAGTDGDPARTVRVDLPAAAATILPPASGA